MDVRIVLGASLLCGIAGCATVGNFAHEHPVLTGVGVALVAGSIAATVESHHRHHNNQPQPAQHTCGPPDYTYCAVGN